MKLQDLSSPEILPGSLPAVRKNPRARQAVQCRAPYPDDRSLRHDRRHPGGPPHGQGLYGKHPRPLWGRRHRPADFPGPGAHVPDDEPAHPYAPARTADEGLRRPPGGWPAPGLPGSRRRTDRCLSQEPGLRPGARLQPAPAGAHHLPAAGYPGGRRGHAGARRQPAGAGAGSGAASSTRPGEGQRGDAQRRGLLPARRGRAARGSPATIWFRCCCPSKRTGRG